MALDYTEFYSGRQSQVLPKPLLVLILLEIIVLILLCFLVPRIYWGTVAIGDGVITGSGSGITVSASCGETQRCPQCPYCKTCPEQPACDCEEYCRQAFGKDKTAYDSCIKERCENQTCEDTCKERYGSNKDAYALCLRLDCDQGDPCETACWKTAKGSLTVYQSCVQRECKPQTCEDICRERYGDNKDAFALCMNLDCDQGDPCETACWKTAKGSLTVYQACVRRDCQPQTCEDICTQRYANNKDALAICLDIDCGKPTTCERQCWESADGSPTTYQYCVRKMCEQQPTTPVTAYPGDTGKTGTTTCTDNDKGRDAQNKGTVTLTTYYTDSTQDKQTYVDNCVNSKAVFEYYCQGNNLASESINCPYGCLQGECNPSPNPPTPSTFTPIIIEPKLTVSPTVLRTVSIPG